MATYHYSASPFASRVGAVLGIFEEHSKMYARYFARVQKKITTQCATIIVRANSSAIKQDNEARRKS